MQFVKELTPSKYVAAEGWYVREQHAIEQIEQPVESPLLIEPSTILLNDRVISSIVDEEKVITITPKQRVVPQEARKIEEEVVQIIAPAKREALPGIARGALVQSGVWFTGNLGFEDDLYYPQLTVQINAKSKGDVHALHVNLVESGLAQLAHAGFYGDGWKLHKNDQFAILRAAQGTPNVRQAFVALSAIVHEAAVRSGLPFGRTIEIF